MAADRAPRGTGVDALADAPTDVLLQLRENLLDGLDRVARSIAEGTFHRVGEKGRVPASQAGQLTLALLAQVNAALVGRGFETIFREG